MAQAGSAQREPSMEEILASIRRIIEDSDTARRPLDEAEGAEISVAPVAAPEIQHDVDAFRAEFGAPPADEPALQPDHEEEAPAPVEHEPLRYLHDAGAHGDLGGESDASPSALDEVPAFHAEERAEPSVFGGHAPEPAAPVHPVSSSLAEAVAAESRQALISDQAGRQVAAAFGELSEAFAASRRRSFDEMAEDMLRPMLQDWLDNNLPMLVEKLVREEIERVARGG